MSTLDSVGLGRRVAGLWNRAIMSAATVSSALDIADAVPTLEEQVARAHEAGQTGVADVLSKLTVIDPLDPMKDLSRVSRMLAKQTVLNAETVIAAASVILSHSTADDVFTEACRIAMVLDPEKWKSVLDLGRSVSLRDLHNKGSEGVFNAEIESLNKNIGNKSLPARAKLLFGRVPIVQHPRLESADPSYFKESALKDADDLRKRIVHGGQLPRLSIADSRMRMLFLHEACYTALRSLMIRYKLPVMYNDIIAAETAVPTQTV
jgi:hypothetical protein